MKKVFIDGQYGTTGLEIQTKLKSEKHIELITIHHLNKKNQVKRQLCYDKADLVVLCLPDDETKQAVPYIIKHTKAKILDCSSSFRTDRDWVYGFAELKGFKKKIKRSRLVSNPGCYAISFIAFMKPLIDNSLITNKFIPSIVGVSGYTGGGKAAIEKYTAKTKASFKHQPFLWYGLDLNHKHLQEMQLISGLTNQVVFIPSIISIPRGLAVLTTFNHRVLKENKISGEKIFTTLSKYYRNEPSIKIKWLKKKHLLENKFLNLTENIDTINLTIYLTKNRSGDLAIVSLIDNLGKGASLNALQNIRLMLNKKIMKK